MIEGSDGSFGRGILGIEGSLLLMDSIVGSGFDSLKEGSLLLTDAQYGYILGFHQAFFGCSVYAAGVFDVSCVGVG